MHAHGAPGTSPVLDIGGDVGALVVYLTDRPRSGELELCPTGDPARRFHTGVHPRRVGERDIEVAVFPEVLAGTYDILDEQLHVVTRVVAVGGEVAEVDLSTRAHAPTPGDACSHSHAHTEGHAHVH